MFVIVTS